MATYSAVSASEKDADSPINVGLIDKLDQNPHAIAEGASGAPKIQAAALDTDSVLADAIASGAVGQSELASGAVHQSELDTSTGEVSGSTGGSPTIATLPGGTYGFYPQTRFSSASTSTMSVQLYREESSHPNTYATHVAFYSSSASRTGYAQQRYVNSSPPIDLGDGDIPLFVFAEIAPNGDIIATYAADVPPWLYNGPTRTQPDIVRKDGKAIIKEQIKRTFDKETGTATLQVIPVTMALKNADMDLIPHPFPSHKPESGNTVILLDPVETETLAEFNKGGESIADLLRDSYLTLDNTPLNRSCPPGVTPTRFRWRNSGGR